MEDSDMTYLILNQVNEKANTNLDEAVELEYGVQDTQDIWDKSV